MGVDDGASIGRWEAVAREHGGALAFLRLDEQGEDGQPLLEKMILRLIVDGELVSFHLSDGTGDEPLCFVVRTDEFERAQQEALHRGL